jgi:hypothetical protein
MATWRLSNLQKKSYYETESYKKDEKTIYKTLIWRWGSFTIESNEKPEIDLNNEDGLNLFDNDLPFEIEFEESSDGDTDISYSKNMSKEEIDEFESLMEEIEGEDESEDNVDSFEEALDRLGWKYDDTEHFLVGPLELELINE